jgi:hypothetical protein
MIRAQPDSPVRLFDQKSPWQTHCGQNCHTMGRPRSIQARAGENVAEVAAVNDLI